MQLRPLYAYPLVTGSCTLYRINTRSRSFPPFYKNLGPEFFLIWLTTQAEMKKFAIPITFTCKRVMKICKGAIFRKRCILNKMNSTFQLIQHLSTIPLYLLTSFDREAMYSKRANPRRPIIILIDAIITWWLVESCRWVTCLVRWLWKGNWRDGAIKANL